MIIVIMIMSAA